MPVRRARRRLNLLMMLSLLSGTRVRRRLASYVGQRCPRTGWRRPRPGSVGREGELNPYGAEVAAAFAPDICWCVGRLPRTRDGDGVQFVDSEVTVAFAPEGRVRRADTM